MDIIEHSNDMINMTLHHSTIYKVIYVSIHKNVKFVQQYHL
jgi:IS30 family transposase